MPLGGVFAYANTHCQVVCCGQTVQGKSLQCVHKLNKNVARYFDYYHFRPPRSTLTSRRPQFIVWLLSFSDFFIMFLYACFDAILDQDCMGPTHILIARLIHTYELCFLLFVQLRQTVFQFVQKELAPKAAQIDKDNNFPEVKVSSVHRGMGIFCFHLFHTACA